MANTLNNSNFVLLCNNFFFGNKIWGKGGNTSLWGAGEGSRVNLIFVNWFCISVGLLIHGKAPY